MKKTRYIWKKEDFYPIFADRIPRKPGVYAIVDIVRALNLPIQVKVLYVGKAKSLRQRFIDHTDPTREHSKALLRLPKTDTLEYWYIELPAKNIAKVEKQLIKLQIHRKM